MKDSTKTTKIGILFGIIASLILGLILPGSIVARGTSIFFGICAAAFLPAYLAAIFWKRATRIGVWASMIAGTLLSTFGLVFLHRSESAPLGICQLLFGKTELISAFPWPYVDAMVYSLPLSLLVLIVVSLMTKPPKKELLELCFNQQEQ